MEELVDPPRVNTDAVIPHGKPPVIVSSMVGDIDARRLCFAKLKAWPIRFCKTWLKRVASPDTVGGGSWMITASRLVICACKPCRPAGDGQNPTGLGSQLLGGNSAGPQV